jgi:RND family efflux transporter MFP subunit
VENGAVAHTTRAQGRVAVDESRIYRLNAALDGWIKDVSPVTTGSLVRKNQLLAQFYTPEFLPAIQSYLFAIDTFERFGASGKESKEQRLQNGSNLENQKNALRNIGMSDHQLEQIAKTRKVTERIDIRAPASGFVIARNVSPGQRYTGGTEHFRIADLSRVWIVADVFERDAPLLTPGMEVRCTVPHGRTFRARVSAVLPQFDPSSRTLKVRLEAENPGYRLRPDMFVDIDLPVESGGGMTVPVDAVLDSGLKKTVFIDRGNGLFEPRSIETGRFLGDRVELTRGVRPGEKVVVAGSFLIDSESRMKIAAAGIHGTPGRDPVCGMELDADRAASEGRSTTHGGTAYYFCSKECMGKFGKTPQNYLKPAGEKRNVAGLGGHGHD